MSIGIGEFYFTSASASSLLCATARLANRHGLISYDEDATVRFPAGKTGARDIQMGQTYRLPLTTVPDVPENRLQVDHVQARLKCRFSHPAVERQDVSRRTRECQCEM